MSIIKQFTKSNEGGKAIVSMRHKHYGHTVFHIEELFKESQKDFPELDNLDVNVVVYAGARINGMVGIEFLVDISKVQVKQEYEYITTLEPTH